MTPDAQDRLAALEDRLNGDVAPEPHTGPFRDVDNALDALTGVVGRLAFGGQDQRVRAMDMLGAVRRQIHSVLLKEDK
jgi:hypothetical protein